MVGIDISGWQKTISWKAIADAGMQFGWIKATESVDYVNSAYVKHRKAAKRLGIPVGAYHYARPDKDDGPIAEAEWFLDSYSPLANELLPALDLEEGGLPPKAMARWAKRWLKHVEKRIGQPPILYTYSSFWQSALGNAPGFHRYPLWLANYGKDDGKVYPVKTVGSWPSIAVHQYTSHGRIRGWGDDVDLNRLMKGWTLDKLRLQSEPGPSPGYGPPWRLMAKGAVVHEAGRLDATFLARVAEQAKAGGVATVRGTPKESG